MVKLDAMHERDNYGEYAADKIEEDASEFMWL